MPNAVLIRKRQERADQLSFVDELLTKVEADGGRDLVDAEIKNLEAARQRVQELDAQIVPLEEHEIMTARHQETAGLYVPQDRPGPARAIGAGGQPTWATAGAYIVDHLRARGYMSDPRTGQRLPADPEAAARIQYALANQTTADTPGLLPHMIVGQVVNLIDASRPFITSIGGGRPMGGIPGKTFGRPKITQHTTVGTQPTEKAELPSQKMVIGEIPFTKATYGGAVDVSRQDIDWSSPAAWDILVRDLADVYALTTEGVAAQGMWAASDDVNAATAVATANTLAAWSTALYAAAGLVYAQAKRLPDRIWCSVDVWGLLGPLTDLSANPGQAGDSNLDSFAGNLFRLPRIVVPNWGTGRCVIGASGAYEVYEEVIGLLSAVEPSLLGVEVAYGGYLAHAAVFPEGLARITPFGVTPTAAEAEGSDRTAKGGSK
jgi:HK97 family phage major capsid protein